MPRVRAPRDLGGLVRARREQLNLTQADLAVQLGVSRQSVLRLEKGTANPDLRQLLRLLDWLGMTVDVRPTDPAAATDVTAAAAQSVHAPADAVTRTAEVRRSGESAEPQDQDQAQVVAGGTHVVTPAQRKLEDLLEYVRRGGQ
jgi:transcriptional regulator with XRE-family HTH domain